MFDHDGKLLHVWPRKLIGPAVIYVDADDVVHIIEHNGSQVSAHTVEGERLAALGVDPWPGTPEQLRNLLRVDIERYGKVARAAGLPRQ